MEEGCPAESGRWIMAVQNTEQREEFRCSKDIQGSGKVAAILSQPSLSSWCEVSRCWKFSGW
jgi:hypothetical protein